jgi:hypothetical protein|tara:strand:+ start:95 stop:379 length:285 start_codon:yes stop_codon:yes gene_type:complete
MGENKAEQSDGTIRLEVAKSTFEYDEDSWVKDDNFIYINIPDKNSYEALQNCKEQRAIIGATIFNYDVMAPGQPVYPPKEGKSLKQYLEFRRVH